MQYVQRLSSQEWLLSNAPNPNCSLSTASMS